jgi:enoyl-CoA hydratase/carnithine racemase
MSVKYEKHGHIAIFTLENGKVNAFTPAMHKQFYDHLDDFLRDPEMHSGVLTGSGKQAFCGGDDIKNDWSLDSLHDTLTAHFHPSNDASANARPGWERELRTIDRYKPIIGAINGPAIGMGFIYAMMFMDIRIASPNAVLGLPEIMYGMGGAGGSTQLWRHLPPAIAMSMVLAGEPLPVEDALRYGLINEIVDHDALLDRAIEIAEKIASYPAIAVRVEMEGFYRSMDLSRRDTAGFMSHLYRLQRAAYLTGENTSANPLDPNAPENNK